MPDVCYALSPLRASQLPATMQLPATSTLPYPTLTLIGVTAKHALDRLIILLAYLAIQYALTTLVATLYASLVDFQDQPSAVSARLFHSRTPTNRFKRRSDFLYQLSGLAML